MLCSQHPLRRLHNDQIERLSLVPAALVPVSGREMGGGRQGSLYAQLPAGSTRFLVSITTSWSASASFQQPPSEYTRLTADTTNVSISSGSSGVSPLKLACAERRVDVVRILLKKRFNVNAAGGRYPSPLESAAPIGLSWRIGHLEIAQLLRASGSHRRENGRKGLRIASEDGQAEMVSYLLDHGEHDEDGLALRAALRRGHVDIAKMLLDRFADLGGIGCTRLTAALEAASRGGHIDMAKMLLDKLANLHTIEHYSAALREAATYGHTAVVGLLLESGAEVNDRPPKGLRFSKNSKKRETVSSSLQEAVGHHQKWEKNVLSYKTLQRSTFCEFFVK
ncbi:ankyrin repeat-containing domain protein [Mycena olivaceomarginata]|nr:ankyrin repeat-containing domain protein [Mycena olivaceomarginata]